MVTNILTLTHPQQK